MDGDVGPNTQNALRLEHLLKIRYRTDAAKRKA
jgi:uncharacterized protein with von Willebrand factor type A (vWA) domain